MQRGPCCKWNKREAQLNARAASQPDDDLKARPAAALWTTRKDSRRLRGDSRPLDPFLESKDFEWIARGAQGAFFPRRPGTQGEGWLLEITHRA